MARRIPLTIKVDYLPRWGLFEGLRELVQNGRDAEVEFHAPLKIDWYNDTLRIENTGCTLPIKALLLGHTTKLNDSRLIGKFGEGLKLGVLALIRAGHEVKIRNGSEVWIPTIEHSDVFDERVLVFTIGNGREPKNRVRIEVKGVTKDAWKSLKQKFLFLQRHRRVDTIDGGLLLDPRFVGKVFVKGIFVQADADLRFGYDLAEAELDRDRRMVASWSLKSKTRDILFKALDDRPNDLFDPFVAMLQEPTMEVERIDTDYSWELPSQEVGERVKDWFIKRHGDNAVPVATLAESKDIEHLGKDGVVVPKPLQAVLSMTMGKPEAIQKELKKEAVRHYGWGELLEDERSFLEDAIAQVAKVEPVSLDDVGVVDFRSPTLRGQFDNGKILLAKKILVDPVLTLRVLIHEVAHRQGDDGDKSHVARIEELWAAVYRNRFHGE